MNSAGPGRPDISMYFFVRPNALSATQLFLKQCKIDILVFFLLCFGRVNSFTYNFRSRMAENFGYSVCTDLLLIA